MERRNAGRRRDRGGGGAAVGSVRMRTTRVRRTMPSAEDRIEIPPAAPGLRPNRAGEAPKPIPVRA